MFNHSFHHSLTRSFYRWFSRHRWFRSYRLLFVALCTIALIIAAAAYLPEHHRSAIAQTPPAATNPTSATNTNSEVYHFKIGQFNAATVSDGILVFPPTNMVPLANPARIQQSLANEFLDPENFVGYTNVLYLDTGRNKVLIDTGSGNSFVPSVGRLMANLQTAGIDPATIDTVILTHAHVDHVGGLTRDDGSLAFPNARYYISQTEWDFWTDPQASLPLALMDDASKEGAISTARKFLGVIEGRVTFFAAGDEVVPGITAVDAAGHTPGQSAFLIRSDESELLLTADVFFSDPLNLEHPDWEVAFDADPAQAVTTRKRILQQVTDERQKVLAYHMPFPGLGYVRAEGNHYEWKPILWAFEP